MPSNYPSAIDSFINPTPNDYEDILSHADQHGNANDAITAIEQTMGTTAGSALFNAFAINDKPVAQEGGTVDSYVYSPGTFLSPTLTNPSFSGGTFNNPTLGTPNSLGGTFSNPTIGTALANGGTYNNITLGTPSSLGGTFNTAVLGTPTIGNITSPGTTVPTVFDRGLAPTVITLTDAPAGTITPNAAAGQVFQLALGTTAGNRTLAAPVNPTNGQLMVFQIQQNSNNTGTIVFNSIYKMGAAGTMTLGTTSSWNYAGFRYYASGTAWHSQGSNTGIV